MKSTTDHLLNSRILIVDDIADNVALLESMLDLAGYENIVTTTDSRDVIDLWRRQRFDLILLDIRMPHLDGIQVLDLLRAEVADDWLPVLVLTAQTDADTRQKALAAGARDYLTKPFEAWEILQRIHNLLETRYYHNMQRGRAEWLDEQVRAKTEEIFELHLEIINRLGRAAEYRDNETGMHIVRMSRSCGLLALAAGLSASEAELIQHASPMHDIGKIGIPDNVLLKPGKLDPAERAIIETHAALGAELLDDHQAGLLVLAREIALTHHEKWDGSGYPNGLSGEQIPIAGRIAAICDVFDALTSPRPYKKAWPLEQAMALLKEESGKHFDARLVDLFIDLIPDIVALRDVYPDEDISLEAPAAS